MQPPIRDSRNGHAPSARVRSPLSLLHRCHRLRIWDLDNHLDVYGIGGACKRSQFAAGGLVGYDFGSFITQFKLAADVVEENYGGRGNFGIIKPLWNPAPIEPPLK